MIVGDGNGVDVSYRNVTIMNKAINNFIGGVRVTAELNFNQILAGGPKLIYYNK